MDRGAQPGHGAGASATAHGEPSSPARLSGLQRGALIAWTTLLLGLLVFPLFSAGQLALRDMMVLDQPALSSAALGFSDLPARNAPQDGLLALVGMVAPASWFVRLLLVGSGILGAVGAVWLARVIWIRGAGPGGSGGGVFWGQAAAVTLILWNPFVVERFLQGHWSLVVAAWLLPLVAVAGLRGRAVIQLLAMWLASLTPTGALFALVVGIVSARGRRRRAVVGALGFVMCLPWVIPGVLAGSTSAGAGASVFAPRAEAGVGTLGSLLGLGGIWNADAVPASREAGFAVFGMLLFAVLLAGARQVPVRLLVLGGVGLGGALVAWLLPGLMGWLIATVPGAGLLRDSQKLVMLAIPAYVAMAGGIGCGERVGRLRDGAMTSGHRRVGLWRAGPAVLVILLAVLQVPDAPRAMQQLVPVDVPVDEELVELAAGRDVLLVNAAPLTVIEDRVVVEPMSKALPLVESGALVVDGVMVDPPSQRWVQAQEVWATGDLAGLAELEIGVVVDGAQIVETGAPVQRGWEYRLGLALLLGWMLVPAGIAAAGMVSTGVRRHRAR